MVSQLFDFISLDIKNLDMEIETAKTTMDLEKAFSEFIQRKRNYKKNRQTLHKYENGTLNIPYEILFEICRIFNIDNDVFKNAPITQEEQQILEKKIIKSYVSSLRKDKNLTIEDEKIINTYKTTKL